MKERDALLNCVLKNKELFINVDNMITYLQKIKLAYEDFVDDEFKIIKIENLFPDNLEAAKELTNVLKIQSKTVCLMSLQEIINTLNSIQKNFNDDSYIKLDE